MRSLRLLPPIAVALAASVAGAAPIVIGPYLQDARPDGATVLWETASALAGTVIVETPGGERRFPSEAGTRHRVRVEGLAPGPYRYRVECGGATVSGRLATAATVDRFTFLVYGDNRDRDADHARVVAAMATEHADLLLQTGDMTGDGSIDSLWRRFFTIESDLLRSTPMYPALGNHEVQRDPFATHFHRYFVLPGEPDAAAARGEARARPGWYSFHYGNSLFIALDGNRPHERAQAEFLERTLVAAQADPSVRHSFVFFHQPPFSAGDWCGSAAEQGLWVPEFAFHGVRAVFTGHDHGYQRLERQGVRYFVSGGGGAPLYRERGRCPTYDQAAVRVFRAVHHYLRVRVAGDEATLEALGTDGELIDAAALHEPAPRESATPPVPFRDPPRHPDGQLVAAKEPTEIGWPAIGIGIGALSLLALALAFSRRKSRSDTR